MQNSPGCFLFPYARKWRNSNFFLNNVHLPPTSLLVGRSMFTCFFKFHDATPKQKCSQKLYVIKSNGLLLFNSPTQCEAWACLLEHNPYILTDDVPLSDMCEFPKAWIDAYTQRLSFQGCDGFWCHVSIKGFTWYCINPLLGLIQWQVNPGGIRRGSSYSRCWLLPHLEWTFVHLIIVSRKLLEKVKGQQCWKTIYIYYNVL